MENEYNAEPVITDTTDASNIPETTCTVCGGKGKKQWRYSTPDCSKCDGSGKIILAKCLRTKWHTDIGKRLREQGWILRFSLPKWDADHALIQRSSKPSDPSLLPNCLDCGLPYEKFGLDLVFADSDWRRIHPGVNGLLCSNCICRRAAKLSDTVKIKAKLD